MAEDKDDDEKTGTEAEKPAVVDASFEEEALEPKAEAPLAKVDGAEGDEEPAEGEEEEEGALPTVMGYRRYIYAAFFSFAIALAYFLSKAGLAAWHRLSQWTPKVGEPREDLMTPIGAVLAAVVVFLVYRRPDVRQLSDEVALELSKVEWPTREKVRSMTTIVVVSTLGSSFAFWLYDIVANKGVSVVTGSNHPLLYGLAAGALIFVIRALGSRFLAGTP